ncbi:uroporphyrinogen-III synthase [Sulfoacidibacillus thermotolerans]|uniref:Tetrapyrrole biosynthesis uroporphyrinogen III synthase domain-containing protein n=1 Tax=Sulfoacidibacillus thermotolerans TaxID=1765684 RepID=A0A2U3DC44_SULT2|nr:uroporphyrinogen-III synthase [Sulfoacidibacillus thermotolerans]PWI58850.1 hypothetical protein BM613_01810 [Sulfoacidibacillus thermotolerans]
MGTFVGKRVAITRPLLQSQEMMRAIANFGAEPKCYPLLEIRLLTDDPYFQQAVQRDVDLVIFTSVNGVRAYVHARGEDVSVQSFPKALCVGEKTAEAAMRAGIHVIGLPERYAAEYIVDLLRKNGAQGQRVLLVRGNLADPLLSSALVELGCDVLELIGYETVPGTEARKLWDDIKNGDIDAVTFLSGSAARVFAAAKNSDDQIGRVVVAAIGPKTQQILVECQLPCHVVAQEATAFHLVHALANYFALAPDF